MQELCNNLASPPTFVLAASCITLLFLLKTHRNDQCCFKPSRSFPDLQGYPPWCFFSLFCLGKFFFSPTAGFSYFLSAGKEFSLSCLSAWKGLHTALMHEECFCWVQTSKLAALSAALLRCRSLSSGFCSFCWKVSHQSYSSERNVLFLQLLLRFFFLSLVFNSVTTMCPDVVFCCCYLVFILLRVHWASWICRLMSFNRFGKFSPAVSLDITSVPFFSPLFSETPMTHKLNIFTIFHVSLLFSHSFSLSFSMDIFHCSAFQFTNLILYCIQAIIALSNEFLISNIVFSAPEWSLDSFFIDSSSLEILHLLIHFIHHFLECVINIFKSLSENYNIWPGGLSSFGSVT